MPVNYRTPSALDLYPVDGVRLGVAEAESARLIGVT
jgi:hypothetical protein